MDVVTPDEERSEESDLLAGTGALRDVVWFRSGFVVRSDQGWLRWTCRTGTGRSLVESEKIAQSGIFLPQRLRFSFDVR
jgi:hypothetical protein